MATIHHKIGNITVSSMDWHNWKVACLKREPSFAVYLNQVDNHPCLPLVSVHFLFSWFKQQRRVKYPERTLHENCVHATWDVRNVLDHIYNNSFE